MPTDYLILRERGVASPDSCPKLHLNRWPTRVNTHRHDDDGARAFRLGATRSRLLELSSVRHVVPEALSDFV